ncbi:MAG: Fatty acid metabolism regulator protein [Candidatus Hydrogenedentota bacterium]|jgi:AcrR family transcriptional regulator
MEAVEQRGPGRPVDPARRRQRRREILDAAARVFSERGYASTDVAQIAAMAGLTKASVYHYFESKEALFFATVDAKLGMIAQQMASLADSVGDRLEGIGAAVEAYLRFFSENPDAVELMIEERSSFKTREKHTYVLYREATLPKWTAALEAQIASGTLRKVPPVATLRLLSDLLFGRVINNFFVGDPRPIREQSEEILDVLLLGLLPRA